MAKTSVKIDGFTVIPVKLYEKIESCHYLYCRLHNARTFDNHTPQGRTLFVVGVPPYCSEDSLKLIFATCGTIDRVILSDKPSNQPHVVEQVKPAFRKSKECFRTAYIVFKSNKAIIAATSMIFDKPILMTSDEVRVETGINKWCREYEEAQTMNTDQLQTNIDEFMTGYDERVKKAAEQEKVNDGVADEDGWITVTRTGKYKGVPRTEVEEERTKAKERKKGRQKELLNFYTFQIRETKRERIADLRKKFEEDKQKIATLKTSRRFRPF